MTKQILFFLLFLSSLLFYPSRTLLSISGDCLKVESPNGDYTLEIHGLIQSDARFYFEKGPGYEDTFLIRRARLIALGTLGDLFDYYLRTEFAGDNVQLYDAWIQYELSPLLGFRFGKWAPPLGLERLQDEFNLKFIERGLPTDLVPQRDIGIMAYGRLWEKIVIYQIGLFNGVKDYGVSKIDRESHKDLIGRIFTHPYACSSLSLLRKLGLGIAGSYGIRKGDEEDENLPQYVTPAQNVFFNYLDDVIANGPHWHFAPQGYYYWGPFGMLAEYTISNQSVSNFGFKRDLQHYAWQLQGSYILTGEENTFDDIIPCHPFNRCLNTWGAVELVARYGELHVDPKTFPLFADPSESAQDAYSCGAGINWIPLYNVKIESNWCTTTFKKGALHHKNRPSEQVLFVRAEIFF